MRAGGQQAPEWQGRRRAGVGGGGWHSVRKVSFPYVKSAKKFGSAALQALVSLEGAPAVFPTQRTRSPQRSSEDATWVWEEVTVAQHRECTKCHEVHFKNGYVLSCELPFFKNG